MCPHFNRKVEENESLKKKIETKNFTFYSSTAKYSDVDSLFSKSFTPPIFLSMITISAQSTGYPSEMLAEQANLSALSFS